MKKCLSVIVFLLIILLMTLLLGGCKTTYSYEADGTKFKVGSYREFQRIEVRYGTLWIKASGVTDDTAEAAVAITSSIATEAADTGQLWLMGGPLKDMTGQPRGATAAEIAAQANAINGGNR